ncbi:hypothetical protein Tco_1435531, partial [Tanacetum coccineum]
MAFRNFMIEEINGEFRFLPKEPTADDVVLISSSIVGRRIERLTFLQRHMERGNKLLQPPHLRPLSKRHRGLQQRVVRLLVVLHVTPPSWKVHLKEISIEKLCDYHDKAYTKQAILDNTLNQRIRDLMSTLTKVRADCDAIQKKGEGIGY